MEKTLDTNQYGGRVLTHDDLRLMMTKMDSIETSMKATNDVINEIKVMLATQKERDRQTTANFSDVENRIKVLEQEMPKKLSTFEFWKVITILLFIIGGLMGANFVLTLNSNNGVQQLIGWKESIHWDAVTAPSAK